jgi:carbon starvation protein
MLAVIALAIVSAYLWNEGRGRYLWVTVAPMVVVMTTTSTAALYLLGAQIDTIRTQLANATRTSNALLVNASITSVLLVAMLACALIIVIAAGVRIMGSPRPAMSESLAEVA